MSDLVEQRLPGFPRELDRGARRDDQDALVHPLHGRPLKYRARVRARVER
jgi:hypothetical protein